MWKLCKNTKDNHRSLEQVLLSGFANFRVFYTTYFIRPLVEGKPISKAVIDFPYYKRIIDILLVGTVLQDLE
jgi:hypothetical protein